MSKQVMSETVRYMWRNKKNRLIMLIAFGGMLLYSLLILPNVQGIDEVDVQQLERELASNQQTFEDRLETGQTVSSLFTGTSAYEVARNEFVSQRDLLSAIRTGDARRYLEIPYRPASENNPGEEDEESVLFLGRQRENDYQQHKNAVYINEVDPLSFHHIHERTSLQQLHLFMIGWGPYVLIFLLLFMISDVVTKDRKLTTQKIGVSKNWFIYLLVQSVAALGFVVVFLAMLAGTFYLVNGLLHGFGSGALPAGFFETVPEGEPFHQSFLTTIPLSEFFLRAFPFLALLLYGFTRLNTAFSLLLKQDVVVLIASMFTLLFPFLYYGEETTDLLGVHLSWFPQTYFHFGEVVTGLVEQTLGQTIPLSRGLIVLAVTILILEGLNFLLSKLITRQKFLA
ncbi:hypothetical protein GCM10008929_04190 [Alkalibacterium psychrotolerans]